MADETDYTSFEEGSDLEDREVELDSGGFSVELDLETEDLIEKPFRPERIDVRTRAMTIDLLLSRLRRGALDLAPDFQRRAGIWTERNQSRLIESLLLRIPLPHFYIAEHESDDTWAVVDGVQRLTTIARFIAPEAISAPPLVLRDLEYLTDYEHKTYRDLPRPLQTRLDETEVIVHEIKRGTPEEVKFNIFGRINTGGAPLTQQELRHALIPGRARELLRELATSREFLRATRGSVNDARMSDREMVLRFLSFRLTPPAEYDSPDLDVFLRDAMSRLNQLPEEKVADLKADFTRAMDAAIKVFEDHAFRKRYRRQKNRSPISKALFETVAVNLAKRSDAEVKILAARRSRVRNGLADLLDDKEFNDSISVGTGQRARVHRRFAALDDLFSEVIDA